MTTEITPFPQANNFELVFSLFEFFTTNPVIDKKDAFHRSNFPYVRRQFDYYINALKWIGLITIKGQTIYLSAYGHEMVKKDKKYWLLSIQRTLYKNVIVRKIISEQPISYEERVQNGLECSKTFERRIHTVSSWLKFFNVLN